MPTVKLPSLEPSLKAAPSSSPKAPAPTILTLLRRVLGAFTVLTWGIASFFIASFITSFGVFLFGFCSIENAEACNLSTVGQLIFSAVSYLLALLLAIYLPGKLKKSLKSSRSSLGLSGLPTWLDILLAVAGLILSLFLAYLLNQLFLSIFPWYNALETQDVGFHNLYSSSDRIIAFLSLVIITPIAEEILFRGWIYGRIRNYLPKLPAALLVSITFGALHGQWNVGLATFALSLVLCSGRELTGTIYAGIILHMIFNALGFASNFA